MKNLFSRKTWEGKPQGAPDDNETAAPLQQEVQNVNVKTPDLVGSGLEISSRTDAYKKKPESLTDSEYEHLLEKYSPGYIAHYTAPYDPATQGGYYERIYGSTIAKPGQPDAKKMRNAKIAASVADALGVLGQMWAAGSGVDLGKANADPLSATKRVAGRQKQMQADYEENMRKYSEGLRSARTKDIETGIGDYMNKSEELRRILWQKRMGGTPEKVTGNGEQPPRK